jgi:hypothetical protein
MESTSFNKTNGNFYEATQTANKWANEVSSNLMEIYKKQMDLAFGFYNNLACSLPEMNKNVWDSNMNFAKPFNMDGISKLFNPFNWYKTDGPSVDAFASQSENMGKKALEIANNYTATLHKQFKNAQANWSELNEKTQEVVQENWKTRREGINAIAEVCNKQMEALIESNKKLLEEINGQVSSTAKQSEKSFSEKEKEGVKATSYPDKAESEIAASKKQSKAEFAYSNHNNKH